MQSKIFKVGDLVRYSPEGKIVDRWADWYGLVMAPDPNVHYLVVVRWNKDNGATLPIRKKDLTVVNESR